MEEAIALCGSKTWLHNYSRQHPLVATAAWGVCSDMQRQRLQQVPWKQVLPVPSSGSPLHGSGQYSAQGPSSSSSSSGFGSMASSRSNRGYDRTASSTGGGPVALTEAPDAGKKSADVKRIEEATTAATGAPKRRDGSITEATVGGWWDVPDELCDLCGGGCEAGQVQLCEVCEVAQYCSDKCYKAAVAAGKHPWAACRALGAVRAGCLGT
jgi:hypothetical protein